MIEITILIISVVVSAITGAFIFFRNPLNRINQAYGLLTLLIIAFSISNHLSLVRTDNILYIRLVMLMSTLVALMLYLLLVYLGGRNTLKPIERLGIVVTAIIAVLDLSPYVFSGLSNGINPLPQPNFAAPLFGLHIIFYFAASCMILLKHINRSKGVARLQYSYLLLGVAPFLFLAPITGFLLPVAFKDSNLIFLSPVYGVFFVCIVGYAVIKHKLFDIRAVVARSIAYAVSLVALAALYGVVVFTLANVIFDFKLSMQAQVFLSIATGLAGLLFQRPIVLFDKLTNSIFYRDAYDPQELFDQLNRVLVASLDLTYLLSHSSRILAEKLKSDFVVIGIKSASSEGEYKITGTKGVEFKKKDIELLRKLTPKYHQSVIVADALDEKHLEIKEILEASNIAVLVRLASDVRRNEEGLGYIVLGNKKSGNPYSNQDVRVLDTVANELIIAIQNALHFEEIQRFNITLQSKVDDATRQLRRTNAKLEALDETKDDFISMASHQLRTPLTSVKGYLSMVLDEDAGKINATQRKMLNQAFVSSQRMVYLIADLLNVSRLKTGKFVIDWAPVDLSKVIQEEISQLVETAEARGIKLTYKKPADFPTVMLDETKTRQVIMNFIDNAIYYTPSGGHIDVRLEDHIVSLELKVVDDGIGVPKAEQHHLFTKFYRARNAQKARPDGTGLGLFMAKKVIVSQGGSVIFESKEGKGSTFGFNFPKVALERLSAAQPPAEVKIHTTLHK